MNKVITLVLYTSTAAVRYLFHGMRQRMLQHVVTQGHNTRPWCSFQINASKLHVWPTIFSSCQWVPHIYPLSHMKYQGQSWTPDYFPAMRIGDDPSVRIDPGYQQQVGVEKYDASQQPL